MSAVDDDDVVAMTLAFDPRKWHVIAPACTCPAAIRALHHALRCALSQMW